jgi:hypothetical protein
MGWVLFDHFYQPEIDAEELSATRTLLLSDSSELRPRSTHRRPMVRETGDGQITLRADKS